jgi:hypothetical protein
MFAQRSIGHGPASQDADVQQVAPGRRTLTQQLDDDAAGSPPLFAQGAEWEEIEPPEPEAAQADVPDPGHDAAMLAYLATPSGKAQAAAPPGTAAVDEHGVEPTHELASNEPDAEGADDAHAEGAHADGEDAAAPGAALATAASASAAPAHTAAATHTTPAVAAEHHLEHKRKGKPFYARQDALNRGTVHDNRVKGHVKLARPGVTVGKGKKQHDEFTLAGNDTKHRYFIAPNSDGSVLTPHGSVTNKSIKHADGRFAVNPAHVRKLVIPGEEAKGRQDCVLTWFGPAGAAWMKVSDLHGGHTIATAADHAAHARNPDAAASAVNDTTRFVVRAGGIAAPSAHDKKQYIKPHQKSTKANHKSDYLEHGSKATGGQVNLCMNLPSKHAPPVAIDVLLPGQMFFVPNEPGHKVPSKYVREIAIYGHNANKTTLAQVWVFGYVGLSATAPDKSRFGWLPLRVVAPAP